MCIHVAPCCILRLTFTKSLAHTLGSYNTSIALVASSDGLGGFSSKEPLQTTAAVLGLKESFPLSLASYLVPKQHKRSYTFVLASNLVTHAAEWSSLNGSCLKAIKASSNEVCILSLASEQNSEVEPTWGVPKYFAEKISKHGLQGVSWFRIRLCWLLHSLSCLYAKCVLQLHVQACRKQFRFGLASVTV